VDNSLWELDGNKKKSGGIYSEKPTNRTPWARVPPIGRGTPQLFLDHARMSARLSSDGLRFDAAHEIQ